MVRDSAASGSQIAIGRPSRSILYKHGVTHRIEFLWSEYLAAYVPVNQGDIVLDVGANVGEFSRAAVDRGAILFALEPDPVEFRSLRANLSSHKVFNLALWNERKIMSLYSKNSSGDSSLIEMEEYAEAIEVGALTLDEFHRNQMNSVPIKLLKLEAEGAEPEIISAGTKALSSTSYIVADVGPERGFDKETTLVPVLNALQALGFELLKVGYPRLTMLFRHKSVSER